MSMRTSVKAVTRTATSLFSTSASSSAASTSTSTSPFTDSSSPPAPQLSAKQLSKQHSWDAVTQTITRRRMERFTADQFSELGSTQNRKTTWSPHHNLHRPPTPITVTQSHLIASGAHLGHSPSLTHRAYIPHIYGTRAGLSYIDTRQTVPALRRAAQVVKATVERDGIVVFVGSLKGAERAVWENAKRLGENGFGVTKWLPGSISNAKEVFGWSEIPNQSASKFQQVSATSFKPSLLVLLSPTLNQHALREATANEIPTIGICDSDTDPRCVTYAIPANDDSPRAVELIAGILGMAGKDGLERKLERRAELDGKLARRHNAQLAARGPLR